MDLGVIERHRSGFMVSVEMMHLAATSPAGGMRAFAMPYMAALHRWSRRSVQLSVIRGPDLFYLESIAATRGATPAHEIGERVPSYCTAPGKALLAWEVDMYGLLPDFPTELEAMTTHSIATVDGLLAELRDVRHLGIASECEEEQFGFGHVAAPVLHYGVAVGALSMSWEVNDPLSAREIEAVRKTVTLIGRAGHEALIKSGRPEYFPKEL
jgi:DNA-binding IclR family transcriptional regulator